MPQNKKSNALLVRALFFSIKHMILRREMRRRSERVRMPSLLLIAFVVLLCGGNAHAQSPYTQRFASSSSEGGKEQQKTRRNINKSDAEWTFATPASKGLSQSSLEVRFAILSFISRSCSFPYSPRPPFQREEEEAPGFALLRAAAFPFLKRGRAHFWGANLFSLSLSLLRSRALGRDARLISMRSLSSSYFTFASEY